MHWADKNQVGGRSMPVQLRQCFDVQIIRRDSPGGDAKFAHGGVCCLIAVYWTRTWTSSHVCGVQVRQSQEHDKMELMTDKHTILTQKMLHVEAEISWQVTETTDVERQIHRLCLHVLQLNAFQFMAELKVTGTTKLLLLLPPFYIQLYMITGVSHE